jgi:hypothetical protein
VIVGLGRQLPQHEPYRNFPLAPNPSFVPSTARQKCVCLDRQSYQNVSRETLLSDWTLKSDKTLVWHITLFLRKQGRLRFLPRRFRKSQMAEGMRREDSSARRALHEPTLDEKRFDNVLDRIARLG